MRSQLGESVQILGLAGRVASCSETCALVEFGPSGFLHLSMLTEGPNDVVIVVSLARSLISPQSLPELKRQVCSTFDLDPDLRIAIRLCELVKFGGEPTTQSVGGTGTVYEAELAPGAAAVSYEVHNQYARPPHQNYPRGQPTFRHAPRSVIDDWLDAWNRHFASEPKRDLYSVPRRYDLASMFSISVAYALLFAGMRALSAPPSAIFLMGIFFTVVGVSQAVLFRGNRPRESSIIAGVVGGLLCLIAFAVTEGMSVEEAFLSATCGLVFSPFAGYLAGTTIGGIWLVADYLRIWMDATAGEGGTPANGSDSTDSSHPLGD